MGVKNSTNIFVVEKLLYTQTDHRPFESIMKKPLANAPSRTQRLLIRLQKYQLCVQYIPGKDFIIADTLSRDPHIPKQDIDLINDIEIMLNTIVENLPLLSERLQELKSSTKTDCELQTVKKMIKGWPTHKKQVPAAIRNSWDIRNDLHEAEGIIMKSQKLVIPLSIRQYIPELLHKAHLGIEKTKAEPKLLFTGQEYPETSNHTFRNVKNASNIDTKTLKKLL